MHCALCCIQKGDKTILFSPKPWWEVLLTLSLKSCRIVYSSVYHYYTGKKFCITSAYIEDFLKKSDMILDPHDQSRDLLEVD